MSDYGSPSFYAESLSRHTRTLELSAFITNDISRMRREVSRLPDRIEKMIQIQALLEEVIKMDERHVESSVTLDVLMPLPAFTPLVAPENRRVAQQCQRSNPGRNSAATSKNGTSRQNLANTKKNQQAQKGEQTTTGKTNCSKSLPGPSARGSGGSGGAGAAPMTKSSRAGQ